MYSYKEKINFHGRSCKQGKLRGYWGIIGRIENNKILGVCSACGEVLESHTRKSNRVSKDEQRRRKERERIEREQKNREDRKRIAERNEAIIRSFKKDNQD